jgi:hypothetical protein
LLKRNARPPWRSGADFSPLFDFLKINPKALRERAAFRHPLYSLSPHAHAGSAGTREYLGIFNISAPEMVSHSILGWSASSS